MDIFIMKCMMYFQSTFLIKRLNHSLLSASVGVTPIQRRQPDMEPTAAKRTPAGVGNCGSKQARKYRLSDKTYSTSGSTKAVKFTTITAYCSLLCPSTIHHYHSLLKMDGRGHGGGGYVVNCEDKDRDHDDVIKLKHFPSYWPFVFGIHRSPVNSPHKSQWRGALMLFSICVWTNGWVNNRDAGDLRRHRAHYDVTVNTAAICYGVIYFMVFSLLP